MKPLVNKFARVEYGILETYDAGISLLGHEVKSLRIGKGNLRGSFAKVSDGEVYLHNMHIHPYGFSQLDDYDPTRPRKLLLKKKEIIKLEELDKRKGVSLVPLKIYMTRNKFKLSLGVGKGKKQYEKREDIKKRDLKREMEKSLKGKLKGF